MMGSGNLLEERAACGGQRRQRYVQRGSVLGAALMPAHSVEKSEPMHSDPMDSELVPWTASWPFESWMEVSRIKDLFDVSAWSFGK